jgi:hypothetical protein
LFIVHCPIVHCPIASIADLAARRVVLETGIICGALSPNAAIDPTLAQPAFSHMRRSGPGGVAHAGEYETAIMLHLRPDLVQMDQAVQEFGQVTLEYFNWDHPKPSILAWQDWWSRMSQSGVCGDPTVATAEFAVQRQVLRRSAGGQRVGRRGLFERVLDQVAGSLDDHRVVHCSLGHCSLCKRCHWTIIRPESATGARRQP